MAERRHLLLHPAQRAGPSSAQGTGSTLTMHGLLVLATQHILAPHSRFAGESWEKGKQRCAVQNARIPQRPKPPILSCQPKPWEFLSKAISLLSRGG